jgi:hypothetical protein
MFRNSLAGARDFYLARSKDGASFTIAKLGEGTWPLKACPMDGGGIAIADGKVVTAWRRNFDIFLARPGQAEKSSAKGGIRQSPLERTGSTRSGRRWRD